MEQSDYQPTLQAWLDSLSGPSESMDETHDAVDRLYSLLELEKPQVVECRGPMQQIFFPGLVGAMFRAGKDYCSESRFERFALDSVEVHDVWKQMWRESADAIDWERLTPFDEGIGEMLNLRIQRHIDRGFRPRLVDQVDKFLGMEEGEKLENIFTQRLFGPFTGLRAAVIPLEAETRNTWNSFKSRLPANMCAQLEKDELKKNNAFDRRGPDQDLWWGRWKCPWIASAECARQAGCRLSDNIEKSLDMWLHLLKSASAYLFCENCCFVYSKPVQLHFDDRWRLHNRNGPAIEFRDYTTAYMWHGVEVDEDYILKPRSLKVKFIEQEGNIEVRRALIDMYGLEHFIRDSAAKKIQQDEFGVLYEKQVPGDEPIVVVKVYNSTPEPDGSIKAYFLRVPPRVRTAKEAVAWTFNMEKEDYNPSQET